MAFIVGVATIGAAAGILHGIGSIPCVRKRHWWQVHQKTPTALIGLLVVLELSAAAIVAFVLGGICYVVGVVVLSVLP